MKKLSPTMKKRLAHIATMRLRGWVSLSGYPPTRRALARRGLLRDDGELTPAGWAAAEELLPPNEAEHASLLATGHFKLSDNPKVVAGHFTP